MRKVAGLVLLLVIGIFSLPVAAFFLDDPATENLILPVQLGGMALIGGLAGSLLPGLVDGGSRRRLLVGAAYGLAAAVVGYLLFWFLVNGLRGA